MEKKSDYSFTISPSAAENIEKIVRYISLDLKNLKAADDLIALFYEKMKDIICFPYSYSIYTNLELKYNRIIRKVKIKNYILFFEIDEVTKTILIVSFFHHKQIK